MNNELIPSTAGETFAEMTKEESIAECAKLREEQREEQQKELKRLNQNIEIAVSIGLVNNPIALYESNELGQTKAAVEYLGDKIKYCSGVGWMVWDEKEGRFRNDYGEAVLSHALRRMANARWDLRKSENNQEAISFAREITKKTGIDHIMGLLKNDLFCKQDEFDKNPSIINCQGETYNLLTGEHYPSKPEHMHTKTTAFRPDSGEPKKFYGFLNDISKGRKDMADWLMRWYGYCLTGDMSCPFFVNLWGGGKNGKSVLLNVMGSIFGSYALTVSHTVVVENSHQSAKHNLAELPGIRLAIVPEVPPGKLAAENVKTITGGDTITAERKYRDPFSFKPASKLNLASNHRLELRDVDTAMQRRIRLIPFEYTVPDNEIISNLDKQLLEEGPQILTWLIQEAQAYLQNPGPNGFPACAVIDSTSKEYLSNEDIIQQFLDSRTKKGGQIRATELYKDYAIWAEYEGYKRPMSQRAFGEKLITKGIEKKRSNGGYYYIEISLSA